VLTRVRAAVVAGGALGSVGRVALDAAAWGDAWLGMTAVPWPTLVVNVTGTFVLALLGGRLSDPVARAAVLTGALGAWTTVSTLAVEVVDATLLREPAGIAYLVVTVTSGVLAAWAGERLAPHAPSEAVVPSPEAGVRS
jgi:CrcB protein